MTTDPGPGPSGDAGEDPVAAGEVVVDARGLRCPLPVLRLAGAVRDLPAGTVAAVLATDPAVEHDVPAWAGMRGHEVVELRESDGVWCVRVRTGPARSSRAGPR